MGRDKGKGKSIMDSIFGADLGDFLSPEPVVGPVFSGTSIIRIRLDPSKLAQLAAGQPLEFLADGQIIRLVLEQPDEL